MNNQVSAKADIAQIRIGFVGDFGLGTAHTKLLAELGDEVLHSEVLALLSSVDLLIGNLECTIQDRDASGELTANLFVASSVTTALVRVPNLHLCLANNHIADYGLSGLKSTLDTLSRSAIPHFGAGCTYADAVSPHVVDVRDRTVGFVCGAEFAYANATAHRFGSAPMDMARLVHQVQSLKKRCDFVIVILHADQEFVDHPSPRRVRFSRRLVDCGADAVIQHHPHVVQGMETYKGKTIAYSLGNWAFAIGEYQGGYQQTRYGAFLALELGPVVQAATVTHVAIDHQFHRPAELLPGEVRSQVQRLEELSADLKRPQVLRGSWRTTCRLALLDEAMGLYYMLRKNGPWACVKRIRHLVAEPLFRHQLLGVLTRGWL
ncbi:CapA family protein [Accumulibacter sp.]|uniref:CapA family protein n=1 Tax=Accumulibacter sp. TaxID=2053492 RepID=UPI0026067C23|nr:CapA family protein [Accumulibacter sp.]